MKKAKTVAPSNMSIQPGASTRPPMQQDSHPDYKMPPPQHDGYELPIDTGKQKPKINSKDSVTTDDGE